MQPGSAYDNLKLCAADARSAERRDMIAALTAEAQRDTLVAMALPALIALIRARGPVAP